MEETDEQGPDEDTRDPDDGPQPDREEEPEEEEEPAEGSVGESVALSPALEQQIQERVEEGHEVQKETPPYVEVIGFELEALNEAKKNWTPDMVVTTPYEAWNEVCGDEGGKAGLARGWHILLAGNTGMGKSLIAINLVAHAVKQGEKVGVISLEMSKPQLITRYMAVHTGKRITNLEWGPLYDEPTALEANEMLEENYEENGGLLLTNERPISRLDDILASMLYLYEYRGCRAFVTDYLQLAWTGNAENMSDRIMEVSHSVRQTAVDIGAVSIGVSQFNRATSTSKESPAIQGMMGGSSLENDGDQVMLLDHTTYKDTGNHAAIIKLLAAKNRHGSCGEIPLMWDYNTLRATQCDAREFEEGADD